MMQNAKMEMNGKYETSDLYLAAYLLSMALAKSIFCHPYTPVGVLKVGTKGRNVVTVKTITEGGKMATRYEKLLFDSG